jgi:hypothetical protein
MDDVERWAARVFGRRMVNQPGAGEPGGPDGAAPPTGAAAGAYQAPLGH